MAPTRKDAEHAFDQSIATYRAKCPKAVDCLVKDRDVLLAFYDFTAEHWVHLRTSNPIESTFTTVRHRSDQTCGAVSRDTVLPFAFKLIAVAEAHWRRFNGFEFLTKVITSVRFADGIEVRDDQPALTTPVAA